MTYKGPGGYGRIMNIVMNLFMCTVFSLYMLWVQQQRAGDMAQIFTPLNFVISFITAFGIGYVTADLIPVFHAGDWVAKKLGLSGVPAYFVTVLIIDLILTTIIGFFMSFINTIERFGFAGMFMSWLSTYPMMLLLGYIVQLIVMKPAMILAKRVTGFDPENPMASLPPMGMPPAGAPIGAGGPPVGAGGPPVGAGGPPVGAGGPPAGGPPAGMPVGAGGPPSETPIGSNDPTAGADSPSGAAPSGTSPDIIPSKSKPIK